MVDASSSNSKTTTSHKICVAQQELEYKVADKTLLNCLENNGVEVHYHCRDGFCGACRVKLLDGQIEYPNGEPLAFVGEGEILPCCCVPTSNISLAID